MKHQGLFFYYNSKNSYNFFMGLKSLFYEFLNEKFLSNLRPKNEGSLISLKILRDIKHQKLFFYYNSQNSYNFPMGLKSSFYEFRNEKFLSNLRPKI